MQARGLSFKILLAERYLLMVLHPKDEHGSGLDRTGSGLKPILAGRGLDRTAIFLKICGSGLERTEKIYVVLM